MLVPMIEHLLTVRLANIPWTDNKVRWHVRKVQVSCLTTTRRNRKSYRPKIKGKTFLGKTFFCLFVCFWFVVCGIKIFTNQATNHLSTQPVIKVKKTKRNSKFDMSGVSPRWQGFHFKLSILVYWVRLRVCLAVRLLTMWWPRGVKLCDFAILVQRSVISAKIHTHTLTQTHFLTYKHNKKIHCRDCKHPVSLAKKFQWNEKFYFIFLGCGMPRILCGKQKCQ